MATMAVSAGTARVSCFWTTLSGVFEGRSGTAEEGHADNPTSGDEDLLAHGRWQVPDVGGSGDKLDAFACDVCGSLSKAS